MIRRRRPSDNKRVRVCDEQRKAKRLGAHIIEYTQLHFVGPLDFEGAAHRMLKSGPKKKRNRSDKSPVYVHQWLVVTIIDERLYAECFFVRGTYVMGTSTCADWTHRGKDDQPQKRCPKAI